VSYDQALPSVTIKVATPDGKMFVIIVDDENGNPTRVIIAIGKAGSTLMAWAESISRLATRLFKNGSTVHEVVKELTGIRADRLTLHNGTEITSGPEGLAKALLIYQEWKSGTYRNVDR
jgi:hypothetical protein